jgi:hypothetical protein
MSQKAQIDHTRSISLIHRWRNPGLLVRRHPIAFHRLISSNLQGRSEPNQRFGLASKEDFAHTLSLPEALTLRIEALINASNAAPVYVLANHFLRAYSNSPVTERVEGLAGMER